MRKLILFPLLAFVFACTDTMPVDPSIEPNLFSLEKKAHPNSTTYTLNLMPNLECEECVPADIHVTPGGMWHFSHGINGFLLTGDLVGEALIYLGEHALHLNSETGSGLTNGTVRVELIEPEVGAFDCKAQGTFDGYMPPDYLYVESGRWFNCIGSGAFDGKRMLLHNTNEANPGLPFYTAEAQIW
jgi:hypothetical protein